MANTLHNLGLVEEEEGKLAEAGEKFKQALEIFERLGSPHAGTARRSMERVQQRHSEA
jgi:Tfp pilus assembly protein PilF